MERVRRRSLGFAIVMLCGAGCAVVPSPGTLESGGGGVGGLSGSGGRPGDGGVDQQRAERGTPPHSCGNGKIEGLEQCDDGNVAAGDGCGPTCQIEEGCTCPQAGQACTCERCGDGKLGLAEVCDDGNNNDGDGCSSDCQTIEDGWQCRIPDKPCTPVCGDGQIKGGEACDDGNTVNGDGCSANCLVEPGATCTKDSPSICTKSVCGNGVTEKGESCDCGTDVTHLPSGCQGVNGLFFGDGTGCSKTCTREPNCRDASGANTACQETCGDGNKEADEECDDGNTFDGDGCSHDCKLEATTLDCETTTTYDADACDSGKCLRLPVVYRDFKNETVTGGHPDMFFLGGSSVVAPTAGMLRSCVPNSGGLHRRITSNDSTDRCWGIAKDALVDGKAQYAVTPPTAPYLCPCQFTDWSRANGGHFPSPYDVATMSPIRTLPNNAGQPQPGWSSAAAGLAGVTLVNSQSTFNQWWSDSALSTKSTGVLELLDTGGNVYQFSSDPDVISGGFFPLDGTLSPGETALCDLWPYWFPWPAACVGDQYLFPPSQGVTAAAGAWVTAVTGRKHNHYFSTEVRYLFEWDPTVATTLKFYGDDDLFIFINGHLVLDLGGIHQRLPGVVTIDSTGMATITEGGILNPTTGGIDTSYLTDPANPATLVTLTQPQDYRTRTVDLKLTPNRTFEIAVFHADRAPIESNYQLTLSGFATKKTVCTPRCGDGVVEGSEECDCGDGANGSGPAPGCADINQPSPYDACNTQCRYGRYCGDGTVDSDGGEECDNGTANNTAPPYSKDNPGDGACTPSCRKPHYCGDGKLDAAYHELCDDGSDNNGKDGTCTAECLPWDG